MIHGGSDGGRFSALWGLPGKTVVGAWWLPRLAHEARDLLGDDTGFVTGPLSAETRTMLERIGALETEETFQAEQARMEAEQARMAAEETTEPMIFLPFVEEPDDPGSSPSPSPPSE